MSVVDDKQEFPIRDHHPRGGEGQNAFAKLLEKDIPLPHAPFRSE